MSSLNVLFLKEVTKNVHENQYMSKLKQNITHTKKKHMMNLKAILFPKSDALRRYKQ